MTAKNKLIQPTISPNDIIKDILVVLRIPPTSIDKKELKRMQEYVLVKLRAAWNNGSDFGSVYDNPYDNIKNFGFDKKLEDL